MGTPRKPLYQRLPEIYHIRDEEQRPPGQLKAYVDILDGLQAHIRDNIETLYHEFFIETCSDWVIQYLADLVGTSHLAGDAWTLRADVARTVHHRRRKGTLGAIESLTHVLTGWAVHTVELMERVAWSQHLNHQRPDEGGTPPIPLQIKKNRHICGAVRGGTVTLRDPALLSFLGGPFDPFAHVVDVKPINGGSVRYNLPNLGVFLWRLRDYTVPVTKPVLVNKIQDLTPVTSPVAPYALRFEIHPLGEPMVLFNTHRPQSDEDPPSLTHQDAVPGPMPRARLSDNPPAGDPEEYLAIKLYSTVVPEAPGDKKVGLTLHMPASPFSTVAKWRFRGANLCAWERGLNSPLLEHEIVVDPDHGRLLIGVGGADKTVEAEPLAEGLFVSATYGFSGSGVGSTGAHPVARDDSPLGTLKVDYNTGPDGFPAPGGTGLQEALANTHSLTAPCVIEIQDSRTYDLDMGAVSGIVDEGGLKVLLLGDSLHIRARSGQRPIIRLKRPLAFRPHDVTGSNSPVVLGDLQVELEGLYITWDKTSSDFGPETALIERAALNRLVINGCTLDPGSHETLGRARQPARYAMRLTNDGGFSDAAEVAAFSPPKIEIVRSICGPLAIDDGYPLHLTDSIVDAASGLGASSPALAVHAATGDPEIQWGPLLTVSGMTCFGRMRVETATGAGGIWLHRLEVHDNQQGCIKFSYFSGAGDRLPQHQACVFGTEVELGFVSDIFGQPGYAQLLLQSDRKILEEGPNRDVMGAFGYLLDTHKWKNVNIRYREFMPVGIRPVLIPVT
jgi:hypothetical protein